MPRGLFITGTDTGVGKTLVACALARRLRDQGVQIGVMKPVETGVPVGNGVFSDAHRLRAAAGGTGSLEAISPFRFADPVAPLAAARRAGVAISLDSLRQAFASLADRHDVLIVEGVGGILAPLGEGLSVVDLAVALDLPVVVVARPALGGVNHALLTLEALRRRRLTVTAVVLNDAQPVRGTEPAARQRQDTIELVRELGGTTVLGPLPYVETLVRNDAWEAHLDTLAADPAIAALAAGLV